MRIIGVLLLSALVLSVALPANAESKFRVAWKNVTTGEKGHDLSWTSEHFARSRADYQSPIKPEVRHWLEEKRKLFHVLPLPAKHLPLGSVCERTKGPRAKGLRCLTTNRQPAYRGCLFFIS